MKQAQLKHKEGVHAVWAGVRRKKYTNNPTQMNGDAEIKKGSTLCKS